ncbi:MAG: cellulase family glycosylhydrolase [Fimbriimonadaceae bacterium]|nr:cellulase family glycosylhydrolase [Fimbriimonadaceae bacterium]
MLTPILGALVTTAHPASPNLRPVPPDTNLPNLRVSGERMIDPAGKPVTLRGANLGNWLMLEFWMLGQDIPDQYTFESILTDRFGEAAKDALMERYRTAWMQPRDWQILQSARFNLVRLPINYRLLEDDRRPYQLRPNAWKWIDRAVTEAARHGMYTILDLHGIQGGQSVYDHTGRSGQNKVWTEPENRKRTAWLWSQIARRYRRNPNVVAYDLFNEPYGGTKDQQVALFRELYPAVRKVDADKLIFAHGNYDDFTHYGSPKANGWRNVGYQMHYYPGLFGNGSPTVSNHQGHLQRLAEVERRQNEFDAPFLIGEFNVVFKSAGGAGMMRRTYDRHAAYGWMSTMWSYKVLGNAGGVGDACWGLVTNADPIAKIDPKTASLAELQQWADGLGTLRLEVYTELRDLLAAENPTLPPLPMPPPMILRAPADEPLPEWTSTDIGQPLAGGLKRQSDGFDLYGGGEDIWGERDQFRFLHRPIVEGQSIEVEIQSLRDTNPYAKAGLMIRDGLAANAACALISVFPGGEVQFAHRDRAGGSMVGEPGVQGPLAGTRLRLTWQAGSVTGAVQRRDGQWQTVARAAFRSSDAHAGAIALSHDPVQLTFARYRELLLTKGPNGGGGELRAGR